MVFRAAGVDVRYVQMDLFDLDEGFGTFDLVFCGSVLIHTWDQFAAIRRLRAVCGRQAIIATTVIRARFQRKPLAAFTGGRSEGVDGREYWTTWEPNPPALVEMAKKAGFEDVHYRGWFWLAGDPPVRTECPRLAGQDAARPSSTQVLLPLAARESLSYPMEAMTRVGAPPRTGLRRRNSDVQAVRGPGHGDAHRLVCSVEPPRLTP